MFEEIKNNINWLAHCKRRISYPVDRADRAGLTAFEYGWKSFNNLYSEFKKNTERERMHACCANYINSDDFLEENRAMLLKFCNIQHKVYMTDDQYANLDKRLSIDINGIINSVKASNSRGAINHLTSCLYTIRNARVHGSFGTSEVSFSFLPKAILQINRSILIAKLSISGNELDHAIDSAASNRQ